MLLTRIATSQSKSPPIIKYSKQSNAEESSSIKQQTPSRRNQRGHRRPPPSHRGIKRGNISNRGSPRNTKKWNTKRNKINVW